MAFSQPGAGGDTFTPADHNGHLVIVYPKSYQDEVQTKNGMSSAADVDIVIVDKLGQDGKPVSFINARLFGNLARSVRNDVGGQVLGRLGQGPNTRGTPPWILTNFTDADVASATPVDAAYRQGMFAPAAAPAAPVPGAATAAAPPQQWQQSQNAVQQPQQWNPGAPPASAPPQQAWNAPAATPAPAAAPQAQWNAPAAAPTPPPAPAAAAPSAVHPDLVAALAARGINLQPHNTQQDAEAIWASLPQ